MPLSLLILLFAMFHVQLCNKCKLRNTCNITAYEHETQDAKVLDALTAQRNFLDGDVYVSLFRVLYSYAWCSLFAYIIVWLWLGMCAIQNTFQPSHPDVSDAALVIKSLIQLVRMAKDYNEDQQPLTYTLLSKVAEETCSWVSQYKYYYSNQSMTHYYYHTAQ